MNRKFTIIFLLVLVIIGNRQVKGQSRIAAKFDAQKMQFIGTKHQQALYLLRYVQKYAHLGDSLSTLPVFLDSILDGKVRIVRQKTLQKYLNAANISNEEIGGSLDSAISSVAGIKAGYFVIHDTSNFLTGATTFPNNIDSVSWNGNRLDNKPGFKLTHIFINRLGASITSNDLSKPIHGTKFELPTRNPLIPQNIIGNFIHVEVIQPRIADPGKKNDAIAITPGFTDLQYQRLALIYMVASFRKGDWLVPTFHAVLDDGIPDGHDDPQNFELTKFDAELSTLYHKLSN